MAIAKYAKVCAKNTPGLLDMFFTEIANLDTVTVTAGEISALTMDGVTLFNQFDVDTDGGKLTMEGKGKGNYFQTNKIEAKFSKLTKELIAAKLTLVEALPCGMAAIILDGNGQAWLVGWGETETTRRPINTMETNFDSGQKPSDEDAGMYTFTLSQESGFDPLPFDSTLNALIVAGTATFIDWN